MLSGLAWLVLGETEMEKDVTANVVVATRDRAPLVPLNVIVRLPARTDAGTEKVTCWLAPAATVNGDEGSEVIPCVSPSIATLTDPVKPLSPVIERVIAPLVAPAWTDVEEGVTEILKSGGGGEGAGSLPPPAQEKAYSEQRQTANKSMGGDFAVSIVFLLI